MLARLRAAAEAVADAAGRRGALAPATLEPVVRTLAADHGGHPLPGPPDRIAVLAESFELTALDQTLLALVAAADLDPNIGLAYGLLDGLDGPAWPSSALLLELAGVSVLDPDARARLNALAPLRWHGLLEQHRDGPWPGRRTAVPTRVGGHLAGDDTVDPRLLTCLGDPSHVTTDPAPAISRAVVHGVRTCWIRSPLGHAGSALACGAVRLTGAVPFVVDLARAGEADPLAAVVAAAVLEAGLRQEPLVLLGAERLATPGQPRLVHLLDACVVPVVAVSTRGWESQWSRRIPFVVEAPRLSSAGRLDLWQSAVDGLGLAVDPRDEGWQDLLSLRLAPDQITRTVDDAGLSAVVEERDAAVGDLRTAVRRLATAGKDSPVRSSATFDDLVLPPPALGELRRLVSWARYRDDVLAQGPLHGAGGKGTGIAALFAGGPGTGKTLAAHVVSDTLGLDLMRVDLSSTVDKYIGETEKNLERVFHQAESMNVVLFFDEADSLFGSRSAVNDSRDRYANLEVSYLLQRMEQFDGITVLATNLRGNLDPAFSRRLQFLVTFPDPDPETRVLLWVRHLSHLAALDPDDTPDTALLGEHLDLAGGDIRNVVLSAAYDAAADNGGRVAMRHLAVAAQREFVKLRKRPPSQLGPWLTG